MTEKSILITGCSSGIGLCLARGLQKKGYRVFASVRSAEDIKPLQEAGLESLQLDLDSSESIKSALSGILEKTNGRLFALINNGAYGQPGAVEDLSRDVLRHQFETNVFGTQELTNLVLPVMRKQNDGRIIQISSLLGFVSLAYRGAYNASKYALEGLSDTLRLELRGTNIYISLVQPGPIVSRFRSNAYAAYKKNINPELSAHKEFYLAMQARLEGKKGKMPFTLPPESVLKRVTHALESPKPKIRYSVTFPTYFFQALKRLFSDRWLDKVLFLVGDDARRK
ncbi:MAG: SDR family NAD(P)-dependent oxidoreductase [Acidiferrobacterales bacterium]